MAVLTTLNQWTSNYFTKQYSVVSVESSDHSALDSSTINFYETDSNTMRLPPDSMWVLQNTNTIFEEKNDLWF